MTVTVGNASAELTREDLRRQLTKGRTYVWPPNDPNAREFISVTTALNAIPKPGLTRWAAKVTAGVAVEKLDILNTLAGDDPKAAVDWLKQAPFSSRDRAADIGSIIHGIVELDALGKHEEADSLFDELPDESSRRKALHARAFFVTVPLTVEHVEFVVYHHGLGYAGTGDFIVSFHEDYAWSLPGVTAERPKMIVDLKTGKGIYAEAALQMSAYRYSENMVDLRTGELLDMPETDGAMVLHVDEDGWELIPVDASEEVFEQFKKALTMSAALPLSDYLIGTPVLRGSAK